MNRARMLFVCVLFWVVLVGRSADAAKLEIPVDVGVGPAVFLINNPIFIDQPVHFGLKISVAGVLNRALLHRFRGRIPGKYRRYLRNTREFKIRPLVLGLIPDSLIISPKIQNTQMYGVVFLPFGLGLGISLGAVRVSLKAGILLTYAFMQSDKMPVDPVMMHFLRPGLEVKLEIEIPITDRFLLSFGWASQVYIPQSVRAQFWEDFGPFEEWVWHFGQAFLLFHFRFPYEVNL